MKKLLIITALLSFALAVPTFGETAGVPLKDVVSALEQGYAALIDVQADFSQRTVIASLKREQKGAGELFIKKAEGKNAKFRFDYKKPQLQQIVCDGRTVWFYTPEEKQVMLMDASAVFEGGNAVALSYLTGMGRVSRDFAVSFSGDGRDGKGNYLLDLVPRKPSQALAKLKLSIAAAAVETFVREGKPAELFPIVSSVVIDHLGNQTYLDFSRIRVNKGMDDALFSFRVPPGVEVVKP